MAWPANDSNIVTTSLDAGSDNPATARAHLKTALDEIKNLINGRNQASGVAGIDASSKIANTQLPNTIISGSSTDLTITPNTGRLVLNSVLKLNPQTRVELYARSDKTDGMIAMCETGDSAILGPVYYTESGAVWRRFSDNTELPSS